MDNISLLMKTWKTVYTFDELKSLLNIPTVFGLKSFLQRAKKSKKLLNPRKGIRTLPVYDNEELACVIYPESYISLETVLYEAGVIFQRYWDSTRVVRNNTRSFNFQEHNYIARKLKDELLYNNTGVKTHANKRMATPERALCDMVYLRPDPQLDNSEYFQKRQSKNRLKHLLPLYPKTVQNYVQNLLITEI